MATHSPLLRDVTSVPPCRPLPLASATRELLLQVDWATHFVEAGCFVTLLDDCHRRPCMSEGGCGAFWLLPAALARLRDPAQGTRKGCIQIVLCRFPLCSFPNARNPPCIGRCWSIIVVGTGNSHFNVAGAFAVIHKGLPSAHLHKPPQGSEWFTVRVLPRRLPSPVPVPVLPVRVLVQLLGVDGAIAYAHEGVASTPLIDSLEPAGFLRSSQSACRYKLLINPKQNTVEHDELRKRACGNCPTICCS